MPSVVEAKSDHSINLDHGPRKEPAPADHGTTDRGQVVCFHPELTHFCIPTGRERYRTLSHRKDAARGPVIETRCAADSRIPTQNRSALAIVMRQSAGRVTAPDNSCPELDQAITELRSTELVATAHHATYIASLRRDSGRLHISSRLVPVCCLPKTRPQAANFLIARTICSSL